MTIKVNGSEKETVSGINATRKAQRVTHQSDRSGSGWVEVATRVTGIPETCQLN